MKSIRVLVPSIAIALLATTATAQKAVPVFKDGEAQKVEAFSDKSAWVQHALWVQMDMDTDGDGKPDRIHVDVTRPGQTDTEGLKVAVIYETSPYFSGTGSSNKRYFWNPRQEIGASPPKRAPMPPIRVRGGKRVLMSGSQIGTWVPRGFAVVHSASPGTGRSQGCPTVGGKNESLAPKAVIDWLNGRVKGYTTPDGDEEVKAFWSTGKVGMTGTSYNGTLPIAAATTGVDGLEAIIPIAPNTSYYHYYRSNGLIRHPGGWMGEDIDVLYDFINSGRQTRREYCNCEIRDKLMAQGFDRVNGDYNDFWAGRNYRAQLGKVKAAVLMVHGFNDWNVMPAHSIKVYEQLKKQGGPLMAYFHQGGHGGGGVPLSMRNRWFSRYLYGVKNGVEKDPRAWIVRESPKSSGGEGSRRNRRPAPGVLTPYADYPNPAAKTVTLHLSAGGQKSGGLSTNRSQRQGEETLIDDVNHSGSKLAAAEESPHRLLYSTPELAAPVHLSGTPKITVRLSSNKPAANFSVWLVSLPWTRTRLITDNVITRGWADPQNHASLTNGTALEKDKFYEMTFELQPDDQIIPAGQKIGLMIFSSDRDFTLWPEPGTRVTLDLDQTSLELPVVGGTKALKTAMGR
ncbi:MAG: Xaa-Pro dipeptidyl-peptidase [Phycisphaeraceae bacterium]|nr:Xaa-Pro dipeptidyl-peptidase [Phycisphaeraceae bacterium]